MVRNFYLTGLSLLILLMLSGTAKTIAQTVETSNEENDWEFRNSSGIPFWIALNKNREDGKYLVIYLELKYFDEEHLRKVFLPLSEQFAEAGKIFIQVYGDKDLVKDGVILETEYGAYDEAFPLAKRSFKGIVKLPRAYYLRDKYEERFGFQLKIREQQTFTIKEPPPDPPLSKEDELGIAAAEGDLEKVKKMLAEGIDVNSKYNNTWTILMDAAVSGETEMVEFLLKKGANIHLTDNAGDTALSLACGYGHLETVKKLVQYGANVNVQNDAGDTPLMDALGAVNISLIKYLLKMGANPALKDNEGKTVLQRCGTGYQICEELKKALKKR